MQMLQALDLKIGQRAICTAGYPHKCTIVIECIKDFGNPPFFSPAWDNIIDNYSEYLRIIDQGQFGVLTSHFISANWLSISPIELAPLNGANARNA